MKLYDYYECFFTNLYFCICLKFPIVKKKKNPIICGIQNH